MEIGSTSLANRKTIIELDKAGRKRSENIWANVSERLNKSRRARSSVNLWKLNKLAEKHKGKIFLVPGKVLGKGNVTEKFSVAALEFSESAKKALSQKGEAVSLIELLEKKAKPSNVMIVK